MFQPPARRRMILGAWAFCLLMAPAAFGQSAVNDYLLGNKPKPFVEPEGFYHVVFPKGFDCKVLKRQVLCDGNRKHKAHFRIEVIDIPKTATVELVALNAQAKFKKKPHFKVMDKKKLQVHGSPAIMQDMSYDYLGNVEYPIGVKAMYLVRMNKLYVLHFESHLLHFNSYAGDLVNVFGSFKPAELDEGGHPIIDTYGTGVNPKKNRVVPESIGELKKRGW